MLLSFKLGFYPYQRILYFFGLLQVFRFDDNLINLGQIDKVLNILGTIGPSGVRAPAVSTQVATILGN